MKNLLKKSYPLHKLVCPGKLLISHANGSLQPFHNDFPPLKKRTCKSNTIIVFIGISMKCKVDIESSTNRIYDRIVYNTGDVVFLNNA